jgi:putative glycosyltransferase (TIGR04372 family)
MVKKIIRLSILQILKIIGNISVNIYKLFFYKNDIRYTSPSVQTYGDALKHYQYVILLSKYYKTDYHVISINREPCKSILPFFFKKENYSFYNEFIYCIFKKILNFLPNTSGLAKEFDHHILEKIGSKFSYFGYYKKKYLSDKDNLLKLLKKKQSKSFLQAYNFAKSEDNKDQSLHKLSILSKKMNLDFVNEILGYSNEYFKNLKEKLNINKKYICIHIRNNNDLLFQDPGSTYEFDKYNLLLNFLLENNYQIIIIGNNKDIEFKKVSNKNIIYYNKSLFQNITNDYYLIINCDFYIGNNSGPMLVPDVFSKFSLILDSVHIGLTSCSSYDYRRYRLKKYYYKATKKEVNFYELVNTKIFFSRTLKDHNFEGIYVEELNEHEKLKELKLFIQDIKQNKIGKVTTSHMNLSKYVDNYYLRLNNYFCGYSQEYLDEQLKKFK